ncbi:single-stranded-DNA-specific exonuclease RecJ [candidate division WOR-3 bacterium]|nr:single-stranded-DNA-specific exonuclease RecJ [candidate division WOR-3 bacterium]
MTEWRSKNNPGRAAAIQIRDKQIPQPIVQILQNRGYETPRSIEKFFAPSLSDLHDPFLLNDMEKAVVRIVKAIDAKERILVHGDYDTDGITGTALLVRNLEKFGVAVQYYIPHRLEEGYGLSMAGIRKAIADHCTMIITVDCGSSALDEIAHAGEHNIDVIVCDHHLPGEVLPPALAVVNPKLPGSTYPFQDLAGVGVAFKLLAALYQRMDKPLEELHEDLDLVALGSVVDIVPLVGENRILAKYGMRRISMSQKKGIQALLKETGLPRTLTSYHLGFIIGPRINACGRMHDAQSALELFLTNDLARAAEIARSLSLDNEKRKTIQDETYRAARSVIDSLDLAPHRIIVLAQEGWHEGVLGIVASRIVSEYYRPAIVLSIKQDVAKGSARSIPGFDITNAIGQCRDMLVKYGGHGQAAGLELRHENLERFRHCINEHARNLEDSIFEKRSYYDIQLGIDEITPEVVHFLKYFEPTGIANPQPVFRGEDLEVVGVPRVVGANHLMIALRQHDRVLPAIAFDRAGEILNIEIGKTRVNCLYSIADDSYTGKRKTMLRIHEMVKVGQ